MQIETELVSLFKSLIGLLYWTQANINKSWSQWSKELFNVMELCIPQGCIITEKNRGRSRDGPGPSYNFQLKNFYSEDKKF